MCGAFHANGRPHSHAPRYRVTVLSGCVPWYTTEKTSRIWRNSGSRERNSCENSWSCRKAYHSVSTACRQICLCNTQALAIENQIHRALDVIFDEDSSRARKDMSPLNLNILRKTTLALCKHADFGQKLLPWWVPAGGRGASGGQGGSASLDSPPGRHAPPWTLADHFLLVLSAALVV